MSRTGERFTVSIDKCGGGEVHNRHAHKTRATQSEASEGRDVTRSPLTKPLDLSEHGEGLMRETIPEKTHQVKSPDDLS
jgi:hypothetical protein